MIVWKGRSFRSLLGTDGVGLGWASRGGVVVVAVRPTRKQGKRERTRIEQQETVPLLRYPVRLRGNHGYQI